PFDANHLRTESGEQPGRLRPHLQPRQVYNPYALERTPAVGIRLAHTYPLLEVGAIHQAKSLSDSNFTEERSHRIQEPARVVALHVVTRLLDANPAAIRKRASEFVGGFVGEDIAQSPAHYQCRTFYLRHFRCELHAIILERFHGIIGAAALV